MALHKKSRDEMASRQIKRDVEEGEAAREPARGQVPVIRPIVRIRPGDDPGAVAYGDPEDSQLSQSQADRADTSGEVEAPQPAPSPPAEATGEPKPSDRRATRRRRQ